MTHYSEKREHSTILAVTIGSILEWYEIYLYIYWAPTISKLFFASDSNTSSLVSTFLIFAIGFVARPLGGILFGRLGDRIGRKKSLLLSMAMMTIPTFLMGVMPTYQEIGIWAPILLGILRLCQTCPAGGELPGAFCYLYETSAPIHRRYMTSWGAVGNQVGIAISLLECFLLETLLSPAQLLSWGWRFSFIMGGCIGLLGLLLRSKLHETLLYREIELRKEVSASSIFTILSSHKQNILRGILFCLLNSAGWYLISVLSPIYLQTVLRTSYNSNMLISISLLIITTVPLPIIGMIGDRLNNKKILIISTLCIILLLYPLYLSVQNRSLAASATIGGVLILCFTCLTALIPYRLADLFHTPIRFTCVGLSYNIVDGIFGGFSPVLALYLLKKTGSFSSFCWILLITALISMASFFTIHEKSSVYK